jgi:transcriptional regulator with XRE-family HTH domain
MMTTIGQRVAWYRESQGLTQYRLAKLSGLWPSQISRLEAGGVCSLKNLQRLASALGVHCGHLLGEIALLAVPPAGGAPE